MTSATTARDPALCTRSQGECSHCEDPEVFGSCESLLTRCAREVRARLTDAQVSALRLDQRDYARFVSNPTWGALRRQGIAATTHSGLGRRHLTDLGREVARLIAEETRG